MPLQINDNFDFTSPSPNFKRDNMTWETMQAQTTSTLDKGHIVYCISEGHVGTYIFTKDGTWIKILDDNGKIDGIPTTTSALRNDSGYITVNDLPSWGEF